MEVAIMETAMLDKNCITQYPIWYRQSVAENVYTGESGASLVTGHKSNRTSKTSNQNPFKCILTTYKIRSKVI